MRFAITLDRNFQLSLAQCMYHSVILCFLLKDGLPGYEEACPILCRPDTVTTATNKRARNSTKMIMSTSTPTTPAKMGADIFRSPEFSS